MVAINPSNHLSSIKTSLDCRSLDQNPYILKILSDISWKWVQYLLGKSYPRISPPIKCLLCYWSVQKACDDDVGILIYFLTMLLVRLRFHPLNEMYAFQHSNFDPFEGYN